MFYFQIFYTYLIIIFIGYTFIHSKFHKLNFNLVTEMESITFHVNIK